MGYSGARGGLDAILAAEDLVRRARDHAPVPWASTRQIVARFRLAVDRVMGEAGLFDEDTAAAAFRQAEGDPLEAAHILRAHRSTLPRLAVSEPVDPDEMVILRRIVPAFREPDGPQLLGRTTDYTRRLLDEPADAPDGADRRDPGRSQAAHRGPAQAAPVPRPAARDWVSRSITARARTPSPFDIARVPARPPAPRSAALAAMARAETGALVALWYRSILGPDGDIHEVTLGEVRHGRLAAAGQAPAHRGAGDDRPVPGDRGRGDRGPRRRRGGPQPLRRRLRAVLRAQRAQGDRDGQPRHRQPPVRPVRAAGAVAAAHDGRAGLRRLPRAPQAAALRDVPLDGGTQSRHCRPRWPPVPSRHARMPEPVGRDCE